MSKRNVLILDDSEIVAHLTAFVLERRGLNTEIFTKGSKALDYLINEENPYPDLIIVDHYLTSVAGVRKTGFMILKTLNKLGKKIPVIVLSSLTDERIKNKYFEMGIYDFVSKEGEDFIDRLNISVSELLKNLQDEKVI
jgi:CheY-like chemotaxis protein